ncbi:coat protein, gamma subunit [Theileria orientalis]|uniref:Coatomer subunit gamma n=1 Tax=Theileria orientalis TaxID=68886 RepID=A0A976MDP6_THEOR|nr:coat protein, gamma subunit [Theileria orientalis]
MNRKMMLALNSRFDVSKPSFSNDKNAILQETKIFSKIPINSKKCAKLLTRILSLLNCGKESLTESESSGIFFGVTRLFEADDERLRRLIYLLIKSLPVNETEIFIVTSSLTKDMNSNNYVYRANAIRSICFIMRGPVSAQIERYLKSSLVDKQPYVSSSTLLCCIGMFTRSSETLKRWFSEITTCLSNKSEMVRFHATILLFLLRFNDKQSIRKLISTLEDSGEHVICFIIRFLTANSGFTETAPFIVKYLSHESTMVKLEASKSVVSMLLAHIRAKGTLESFGYDLAPVLEVFKHFLTVGDVFTFAAMRQISILAQLVPEKINVLNKQLEVYISDKNRTLSSLALVTLLQTGSSNTIENLLNQASGLSGEFKLEVTRAIKRLCISHPDKYKHVLRFMAFNFRNESSFASKREMVDATIFIVREIPKARNFGVLNLCEFIEDCEYSEISTKVLKFLGENIPNLKNPHEYVRFIYNRLILENALVRSASIDALESIANKLPELRECIIEIIRNTNTNDNFELQEQVNVVYNLLLHNPGSESGVGANVVTNLVDADAGPPSNEFGSFGEMNHATLDVHSDEAGKLGVTEHINREDLKGLLDVYNESDMDMYLDDLSRKLQDRVDNGVELVEYDLSRPPDDMAISVDTASGAEATIVATGPALESTQILPDDVMEKLEGKVEPTLTTSLTEEEEDYNVSVNVFCNAHYLVLQFSVENTLNNQFLEEVSISLDTKACNNPGDLLYQTGVKKVDVNDTQQLYAVLRNRPGAPNDWENTLMLGPCGVTLNFTVNCSNDKYKDSFKINNLNFGLSSYMAGWELQPREYVALWTEWERHEVSGTFNLQFRSLAEASSEILKFFGMKVCTDGLQNKISWSHLSGSFLGTYRLLAKASFAQPNENMCILKLQLRSKDDHVSKYLMSHLE